MKDQNFIKSIADAARELPWPAPPSPGCTPASSPAAGVGAAGHTVRAAPPGRAPPASAAEASSPCSEGLLAANTSYDS